MRILAPIVLATGFALGQAAAPLKFVSATVKPFDPQPAADGFLLGIFGGPGTNTPTRITFTNQSLKHLLMYAYGVKEYQIESPEWMDSVGARFVIEASLKPGTTQPQVARMLQTLLAGRFRLAVHRQPRELDVHELRVAAGGSKLKESAAPAPGTPKPRPGIVSGIVTTTATEKITATAQTVSDLAGALSSPQFGPVLDKTGLAGTYDFALEFAVDPQTLAQLRKSGVPNLPEEPSAPNLVAALQKLGLSLNATKARLDMLIVDHCESKPIQE